MVLEVEKVCYKDELWSQILDILRKNLTSLSLMTPSLKWVWL